VVRIAGGGEVGGKGSTVCGWERVTGGWEGFYCRWAGEEGDWWVGK
jgi:hypothetical protein